MQHRDQKDPHRRLVNRPVAVTGRLVRRWPAFVVATVIAITVVLASFSPRAATDSDGMAPDNPEVAAAVTLSERFGGSEEEIVQILVKSRGEGLVDADGLAAVTAIERAVRSSAASGLVADTPDRPGIVSWLFPAQRALADAGARQGGDAEVRSAYDAAIRQMPNEQAGLAASLLADGAAPDRADAGLILVFLDTDALPDDEVAFFEELTEIQVSLADAVEQAVLPAGITAEPLSRAIMFADIDDFDGELARLFGGAFAIIVLILAFVYWVRPGLGMSRRRSARRSAADVLLSMGAIVAAVLWMNGTAALLGPEHLGWIGPMSQFAQVIPVLLIGLGVDYAIHIASRYREELGTGSSVSEAIGGAVNTVGVALVLATAATAIGFLTNIASPIPDIRDFGILAAVGIVSAFIIMLTFVPAARLMLDRRAERTGRLPAATLGQTSERALPSLMAGTAVLARRVPVQTLVVTVLLAGLGLFGLTRLETHFSDTDMIPEDSAVLATLQEVTERFGGGFDETTEVLITGEVATASVHNALVESHEGLGDVDDVMQHGGEPAAQSPITLLAQLIAPGPDGQPAVPSVADVAADIGVRADLTVPAGADVAQLYSAMQSAVPEAAAQVLTEGLDLARVTLQTSAGEEGAGELETALGDAFAPMEIVGATAVATGQVILGHVIVSALQDSQVSSMAIALLAAMLLLVATFAYERRRPLLGVVTVVPVVLAVLWTFGMMAATGIPFGPITALIASIAIGIGLPYSIHVTHRFLEDRERHADVGDAIETTLRQTGGAMAGSAFTTSAGFGILVTSSLLPFRQLGLVTVYAVVFALLAATLVVPSLLVLWHRWHARRQPTAAASETERRQLVGA